MINLLVETRVIIKNAIIFSLFLVFFLAGANLFAGGGGDQKDQKDLKTAQEQARAAQEQARAAQEEARAAQEELNKCREDLAATQRQLDEANRQLDEANPQPQKAQRGRNPTMVILVIIAAALIFLYIQFKIFKRKKR